MSMNDEGLEDDRSGSVWSRGLFMLIFAILFSIAETVLLVVTIVQFFWMLFSREKHAGLASFGVSLANWAAATVRFQTGVSEEKPFPWGKWE